MTGWEVVGVCLAALPFVVIVTAMAFDDFAGAVFAVTVTLVVLGVTVLGVMLASGELAP